MPTETIETIDRDALAGVSGGTTSTNDQLTAMLTQITASISNLSKTNQNQMDPTMMMMMMMMGGGGGGGGGGYIAAGPAAGPPVINVDTSVAGGGRGGFGGFLGGGGCRGGGCGSKKGW
jgi:hypothetical protein